LNINQAKTNTSIKKHNQLIDWWPFKSLLNRCDSQELFSGELWLLGVIFWIFEFLTWIKLEKRLSLTSSKSCIHTFTFYPFLMMTIKWFLFDIIKTMHDPHSPPFWWWCSLSKAWSFWHHQNLHDLQQQIMKRRKEERKNGEEKKGRGREERETWESKGMGG